MVTSHTIAIQHLVLPVRKDYYSDHYGQGAGLPSSTCLQEGWGFNSSGEFNESKESVVVGATCHLNNYTTRHAVTMYQDSR